MRRVYRHGCVYCKRVCDEALARWKTHSSKLWAPYVQYIRTGNTCFVIDELQQIGAFCQKLTNVIQSAGSQTISWYKFCTHRLHCSRCFLRSFPILYVRSHTAKRRWRRHRAQRKTLILQSSFGCDLWMKEERERTSGDWWALECDGDSILHYKSRFHVSAAHGTHEYTFSIYCEYICAPHTET